MLELSFVKHELMISNEFYDVSLRTHEIPIFLIVDDMMRVFVYAKGILWIYAWGDRITGMTMKYMCNA